jgi:hypothetical protein
VAVIGVPCHWAVGPRARGLPTNARSGFSLDRDGGIRTHVMSLSTSGMCLGRHPRALSCLRVKILIGTHAGGRSGKACDRAGWTLRRGESDFLTSPQKPHPGSVSSPAESIPLALGLPCPSTWRRSLSKFGPPRQGNPSARAPQCPWAEWNPDAWASRFERKW